MVTDTRPVLTLYAAPGCGLCRETRDSLQALLEERAARGDTLARVREVDITSDETLHRRFLELVPVLELDGEELPLATSVKRMRAFLERTLDSPVA